MKFYGILTTAFLFLSPILTNAQVDSSKIVSNPMNTLLLNQNQSILLPSFNTTPLLNSSIENIVLSLYVLDIKLDNESPEIHITINPFDPDTKLMDDGISSVLRPKKDEFSNFVLPRELFEKIIATNKRLLVKTVDSNVSLIFAGVNEATTDPHLIVEHSEKIPLQEIKGPITINNYYNIISNSEIIMGGGIINNQNSQENFLSKFLWYFIVPVLVGLVLFYIFKIK